MVIISGVPIFRIFTVLVDADKWRKYGVTAFYYSEVDLVRPEI